MPLPADLVRFLEQELANRDAAADWARGGAWLTGAPLGSPLVPPGKAASMACAAADWFAQHTGVQVDGASLLTERAAYTGRPRAGSRSVGGASRFVELNGGIPAVLTRARDDDIWLYEAMVGQELSRESDNEWWHQLRQHLRSLEAGEFERLAVDLSLPAWTVPDGSVRTRLVASGDQRDRVTRQLQGVRVVDFSSLWAGPLAASLLGLAGAEVVKVESTRRVDGARFGNAEFYELLHEGQRSVSFDPAAADDLAALRELVESADIIIEASRPRALQAMGLDAQQYVDRGACWISLTAAGRDSGRVGFGDDIAASAGTCVRDESGRLSFVSDALADPLAGVLAAAICATRPVSGIGELWDLSMSSIVASTLPDGYDPRDTQLFGCAHPGAVPPTRRSPRTARDPAPLPGADNALFGFGSAQ